MHYASLELLEAPHRIEVRGDLAAWQLIKQRIVVNRISGKEDSGSRLP